MNRRTIEVDAYLRDLEPSTRVALEALRSLILEEVPDAVETMRYRMPTYEYKGKAFCAFASQKSYMSFYVMNTRIVGQYRRELSHLNVGKSCIRFNKWGDFPLDTIKRILRESTRQWNLQLGSRTYSSLLSLLFPRYRSMIPRVQLSGTVR